MNFTIKEPETVQTSLPLEIIAPAIILVIAIGCLLVYFRRRKEKLTDRKFPLRVNQVIGVTFKQ